MGFNRITSVEVNNFMVYNHAVINFDDLNIINIKGYNSGGKSTMLKAIAVCLMNMYPKAQTKFIRHGEKYFRIIVKFEDGVSIVRDKYVTGQSLYELYKDGKCIFTTKEGGKLTKVDGVPQIIQDYLGLCIVSTGCLNYQVRQDPLWLIETTGSENYNSLNEILKTEEIARANALLNSDKNKLNSEITGIEASLQETNLALNDVSDYTEDLLVALERKESLCREYAVKYRELKDISGILDELSGLKDIPEVSEINSSRLEGILSVLGIVEELGNVKEYPEIEKVKINRLTDIATIGNNMAEAVELSKGITPEVSSIDTGCVEGLEKIIGIISEIKDCMQGISKLNEVQAVVKKKLDNYVAKAKEQGIKFVECDNCGTYIEVSA